MSALGQNHHLANVRFAPTAAIREMDILQRDGRCFHPTIGQSLRSAWDFSCFTCGSAPRSLPLLPVANGFAPMPQKQRSEGGMGEETEQIPEHWRQALVLTRLLRQSVLMAFLSCQHRSLT
jgi:hypothetical protein